MPRPGAGRISEGKMIRKPAKHLENLLREVIIKYQPNLVGFLDAPQTVAVTAQQLRDLRESIGYELCDTGLNEDDQPNERGFQLEELIDWLGRELIYPPAQ